MTFQSRYTPRAGYLPALSIQQPFAEAILAGVKSIELREWPTPYRGPLLLHAGKRWYWQNTGMGVVDARAAAEALARRWGLPLPVEDYPRGYLVGSARLIRCARFTPQTWKDWRPAHRSNAPSGHGVIGWWLEDVIRFAEPIPWAGAIGLQPVALADAGVELRDGRYEETAARRAQLAAARLVAPERIAGPSGGASGPSLWDALEGTPS